MITTDQSIHDFVESLAARTPTPGGGSAGGCAAAMGAALLSMAGRFSQGKKHSEADAEDRLERVLAVLDDKRAALLPMIERDASAFELVTEAYRLPKGDAQAVEIRTRAIQEALRGAMAVPEETLCLIRDVLVEFADVVTLIGRNIVSDVGSGTSLLEAAASMAKLNVQINMAYLEDRDLASAAGERILAVMAEIEEHARRNHRIVRQLLEN
ncbi:MAG: cyclodeaminase/cyclohydrolase family protein [Planctomycetes bacterium]|nr:cyclodeaminase/cyclohydrolase family protein [Planctomycetota bacterium]